MRRSRKIDFGALSDFRYEIRQFLNFSEDAARAAGIEPQQHQALLAIKGRPTGFETTVGGLAERLLTRHHSAVELSRRLEKRGWIRRSRSGPDKREVQLRLTPRAEKILAKLSVAHREELRKRGPRLVRALSQALRRQQSRTRP
jgi:DNA-binding MarR family transcriptional regulator